MMKLHTTCAILGLVVATFAPGVKTVHLTLTVANFDDELSGKSAFVKFHAPWCGHCKRVKPIWKELGDAYSSKKNTVIGDVDCTHDDSKDLCTKYGVRGFPTFKYFTDATDIFGHKYEGDRTFEGFKDIVETKLGPGCGINHMDRCSEEQQESVEIYKQMDDVHRNAKQVELSKLIKDKEDEWKTETDELQKEYDQMGNQRNQMKVYELQSKYQRLTMEKDAIVTLHKPRLRLLQGVIRDTSVHSGREEEF